jgi:glycosyltransferase involved in cell wall biosynthesis
MTARPAAIAICFGTYPPERNGGSDFVGRFALALAAEGCRVHVVSSRSSLPEREEPAEGVAVHRVVDDWTLRRGSASLRRVNHLLRGEGVGVIHVIFPDSVQQERYQLPPLLGLGLVPLVTTFWNLGLGRLSPTPTKLASLALLARSRVLLSHDPQYLASLRRIAIGRPVRLLPVGNNIGVARRGPREKGPGRLAYFGQLDATRGAEDLLEAVAALVQDGRDVRLVMIGSAGRPDRYPPGTLERYYALIARLGIEEHVEWTPYLDDHDAAQRLAGADVCVLPYRRNSLGRSALAAALENGVPVVVAGAPGALGPLRDGVDVAIVPPASPRALSNRIAALLDDPSALARLEQGAREAASFFSWTSIARTAIDVYGDAVRVSGSRR